MLKTIIFLLIAFFGVTYLGYLFEVEFLKNSTYRFNEYLLYLLGYGSIDESDIGFKLVFSVGSLFVLTLFSSACTVTWLESRRSLKTSDTILIGHNENGDYIANICLKSTSQSIYNANVKVIINIGRESFYEDVDIAYIPRKSYRMASFDIKLNSVFYKHFKEILENRLNGSELIVAITYSDVLSGEEYTVFKKYCHSKISNNKRDFIFCADIENSDYKFKANDMDLQAEFESFILLKKIDVDMKKAQIIDCKSLERFPVDDTKTFDVIFEESKSYKEGDFQMLCTPIDIEEDWGVYYDMNAHLKIELAELNDIDVIVEIKKDDGRTLMLKENTKLSSDNLTLDIDLRNYRRNYWQNLKEVCFTVPYSNVRDIDKKARFVIKSFEFIL